MLTLNNIRAFHDSKPYLFIAFDVWRSWRHFVFNLLMNIDTSLLINCIGCLTNKRYMTNPRFFQRKLNFFFFEVSGGLYLHFDGLVTAEMSKQRRPMFPCRYRHFFLFLWIIDDFQSFGDEKCCINHQPNWVKNKNWWLNNGNDILPVAEENPLATTDGLIKYTQSDESFSKPFFLVGWEIRRGKLKKKTCLGVRSTSVQQLTASSLFDMESVRPWRWFPLSLSLVVYIFTCFVTS